MQRRNCKSPDFHLSGLFSVVKYNRSPSGAIKASLQPVTSATFMRSSADHRIIILILNIGHRSEVYKQM